MNFLPRKQILNFLKKLTLIDYLIVIVLVAGILIAYQFLNPEEKWVNVTVIYPNAPIFQAYAVRLGDFEKDPSGKKIAEIDGIQVYDISNNITTVISNNSNKDLFIQGKILVKLNPRSKEYEFKNKNIKVGTQIELRFNSGLVNGTVADIEGVGLTSQNQTKIITLKMYSQWPWLADNIKIGDAEQNSQGQKTAEIISKDVVPAVITLDTISGDRLIKNDPQKVDITLKVRVLVNKIGDDLLFGRDKRVIVGELFSFSAGNTLISDANIIKIE